MFDGQRIDHPHFKWIKTVQKRCSLVNDQIGLSERFAYYGPTVLGIDIGFHNLKQWMEREMDGFVILHLTTNYHKH